MAGDKPGETPEGDEQREIIALLRSIDGRLSRFEQTVKRYGPALDSAARLAGSPAARVAGALHRRGARG